MRLTRTSSGAVVSLTFTCVAWLSLVARFAGGPFELVPGFLLLGFTGAVVGLAAALIERTRLSLMALITGCAAPVTTIVWVLTLPSDAL
jgi:hypothetical protein